MKCLRVLYILVLIMSAVVVALSSVPSHDVEDHEMLLFDDDDDVMQDRLSDLEDQEHGSLRGLGRFLVQKGGAGSRQAMTCNKYPRVCRAKGSQGPDCCKKKCVNTSTDRLNCGMCGKKCKYPEICCNGKCVNPLNDRNNCGGCKKKCKKGFKCGYGMCNYA